MKVRTKIGVADIMLCFTSVLLAVIILILQALNINEPKHVIVKTDSGEAVYDLSADAVFTVNSCGHTLTLEIKDHAVRVKGSNCPDKICVAQGWTDSASIPIVCAPAKVLIRIQNSGGDTDADFIAGR